MSEDRVPEGCVESCSVEIVAYLQPDGTQGYEIAYRGDASTSTYVGLLEMAKHDTLVMNHRNYGGPSDS